MKRSLLTIMTVLLTVFIVATALWWQRPSRTSEVPDLTNQDISSPVLSDLATNSSAAASNNRKESKQDESTPCGEPASAMGMSHSAEPVFGYALASGAIKTWTWNQGNPQTQSVPLDDNGQRFVSDPLGGKLLRFNASHIERVDLNSFITKELYTLPDDDEASSQKQITQAQWSVDGTQIAFTIEIRGKFHPSLFEVWTMCGDGTGVRKITELPNTHALLFLGWMSDALLWFATEIRGTSGERWYEDPFGIDAVSGAIVSRTETETAVWLDITLDAKTLYVLSQKTIGSGNEGSCSEVLIEIDRTTGSTVEMDASLPCSVPWGDRCLLEKGGSVLMCEFGNGTHAFLYEKAADTTFSTMQMSVSETVCDVAMCADRHVTDASFLMPFSPDTQWLPHRVTCACGDTRASNALWMWNRLEHHFILIEEEAEAAFWIRR